MAKDTILLVDDKPNNLEVLSAVFAEEGYEVRVARSGAAALTEARTVLPDVVVTDLKMPGINGLEFFRLCTPSIPRCRRSSLPPSPRSTRRWKR